MRTYYSNKLCCIAIFIVSLSVSVRAQGKEQAIHIVSDEDYNAVLDLLFPLDSLKAPGRQFVTVLRYISSLTAESQIVMVGREGYVQVTEYKSLDGNLNYKLSEMLNGTEVKPAELAKRVRVNKRDFRIPYSEAQMWRRNLLESINMAVRPRRLQYVPPPEEITVLADGTENEVWDDSSGDLHFVIVSSESEKRVYPNERQFVRWMNVIRREVAGRK